MTYFLTLLYRAEVVAAIRLEALGAFWADRALRRLGKLSAKFPEARQ